jgi:hypothetical protein
MNPTKHAHATMESGKNTKHNTAAQIRLRIDKAK